MSDVLYIRKPAAAKMLGVCERTIDYWRKRLALPAERIGGVLVFSPAKLREWAQTRQSGDSNGQRVN